MPLTKKIVMENLIEHSVESEVAELELPIHESSIEQDSSVPEWKKKPRTMLPGGIEMPPLEDELPYSDGEPTESEKHLSQMTLLIQTLTHYYNDLGRKDVAIHGNLAMYFSLEQAEKQSFRAPDFFVALGTKPRATHRKSWVMWQEGRSPNLVIELLSDSTKANDRGIKKEIYQDVLRVPEYILHDVDRNVFEAYRLRGNGSKHLNYEEVELYKTEYSDVVFMSAELDLELVLWEGEYDCRWDTWLRWRDPATHELLPTGRERGQRECKRAEEEKHRADEEKSRADEEKSRAEQATIVAAQERERAERLAAKLLALGINPEDV